MFRKVKVKDVNRSLPRPKLESSFTKVVSVGVNGLDSLKEEEKEFDLSVGMLVEKQKVFNPWEVIDQGVRNLFSGERDGS